MNLSIRRGTAEDTCAVAALYDQVSAYLEAHINYPGWRRGVYPAQEDAEVAAAEGTLFLAEENEKIVGSFILSHRQESAFAGVQWQVELAEEAVMVIHMLAVSPHCSRRGVGRRMLEFAVQYAREQGVKAIRLDVTEGNLPAMRLYESGEFQYVDTVSLGLEEAGLDHFLLYERLL